MKRVAIAKWVRWGRAWLGIVLVCVTSIQSVIAHSDSTSVAASAAWASPNAVTVKQISNLASSERYANYQANLTCSLTTYKIIGDDSDDNCCMVDSAYGMYDDDNQTMLFNNTDRALPLLPYTHNQVITPWPGTVDAVSFDPTPQDGAYLNMYSDLPSTLTDQRNYLGVINSKQISTPPDIKLLDKASQPNENSDLTATISRAGALASRLQPSRPISKGHGHILPLALLPQITWLPWLGLFIFSLALLLVLGIIINRYISKSYDQPVPLIK